MVPFLRPHRHNLVVAFGAAVVGLGVTTLVPLFEKIIMDDVILHHRKSLAPWLGLLLGAGLISFVMGYVRRYVGGRVALDVQYDLRNAIFARLQRLDFARHDEMQTGQLVSRSSSDVALIQGLLGFLPMMSGNVISLVASLVIMFVLSPLLALVAVVALPLMGIMASRLRTSVFPASWDAQQKAGEVAGIVDEAVSGVRVVKAFGQEHRELDRLTRTAQRLFGSRVRTIRQMARLQSTLQAVPALAQVAVLGLGGWLALHHRITLGTFLAFSSYMLALVAPVRMMAAVLAFGQQARAGAERILDILSSNSVVTEKPGALELPGVSGQVEFTDVSFGYLRSEPVLSGFNLKVSPGETVALVGASGSGKSTVALLLPRFYDVTTGSVTVDGVNVADVTFDSLRSQIGVVFEDSFLFSDTVRSNIAYGRPDASEAEIVAAARAAEAESFILALPRGYDTVVGERGLSLSGGQRQRVALARALITDPRILILDDATSAIDARTEEEIHATLSRLMEGRTTLLVAHRRSSLRLADRIVVVEGGRVVAQGSHDQLQAESALYRLLLAGPGETVENTSEQFMADPAGVVTVSAWRPQEVTTTDQATQTSAAAMARMGMGPGGGGGHMGAALLSATPELLARVESLPPANDQPDVDMASQAAHDPGFTLRGFTRPFRRALAGGVALVVVDTLLTLAGPALVSRGIDRGVVAQSEKALWVAVALFLVATVADWADTWWEIRYTGRTAERLLFALRVRIFAQLQRLGVDFYDREMAGRVMTRMTTDVEAMSNLLQTGLINALVNLFTFAGVGVALALMNAKLTLITFVVLPPLAVATIWFRRGSQRAYTRARDRVAAVNTDLQESLSGVRVAQAYGREDRNVRRFKGLVGHYLEARLDAQRMVAVYFPFVLFLSDVAAAIVLGFGAHLVTSHRLQAGELIAFILYLNQFFSPIQQLSQTFDQWQQARASMIKINELMAMQTSTPEAHDAHDPGRVGGSVRLEGVHFAYAGADKPALDGVNLEIFPGQTVALVGETGAGKSTVVKLMARFYDPSAGRVLIDGTDLKELDLSAYRRRLGYVPQEAFLFTGSVRDNIAYGRPGATDAEVEEAARAVGAHEFIAGLRGGYWHWVAERGRSLSSGQRQLIALARARLVDPAILLLDEATSNLDLGTEALVSAAMGALSQGRTTVLIAHRLQTARNADRIVVLERGRVVEDGSHDALLAQDGYYAAMWAAFEVEPQVA
ncbi:MAG: ABC transporter ATP-binding protein [Acidimicrobiales bacterium]